MTSVRNRLPITMLEGILPLDRARIPVDVVAGITLAALAIPEVMGYTKIAGMPVITGLYTIVLPLALYALFGSSRHLVVGADSASAAILAAGLAGMAATASGQYVALAGLVALISAAFLFLARLVRLGFLADFLSRTVLIGFLTGVGIQVAMGQVAGMLGVSAGTGGTLEKFWHTIQNVGDTSGYTLLVSLAVLAVILGGKYVTTVIPGALIAVIGAIAVSWAVDLEADGVAVLGPVPSGLPSFGLPDVAWSDVKPLLTTAFSIFVVILAQSAATSRAYAAKYGDRFSEDVDLVGLGFANVGAGLTGTFVVNGSPTKTQMVDSAGGRSQVAALTTVGIVVIVLLFLTKPLQYMPEAVLSSVVFLIGIELVKVARHAAHLPACGATSSSWRPSPAPWSWWWAWSRGSCSRSSSRSSTTCGAATSRTTPCSCGRGTTSWGADPPPRVGRRSPGWSSTGSPRASTTRTPIAFQRRCGTSPPATPGSGGCAWTRAPSTTSTTRLRRRFESSTAS